MIGSRSAIAICASLLALVDFTCPAMALARSDPSVTCSITSTSLVFGEYRPYQGTALDITSSIIVTCTTSDNSAQKVEGTISLIGARSANNRQLKQGDHSLQYQLYLDPARTRLCCDGSDLPISGMVSYAVPFRQTIMIYGRIPGMQLSAPVDNYADFITATLDY